jgi:hypothetical protein
MLLVIHPHGPEAAGAGFAYARGLGPAGVDVASLVNDFSKTENGLIAFAASQGAELSQESSAWGHGAFSLALIEGIGGGKADLLHTVATNPCGPRPWASGSFRVSCLHRKSRFCFCRRSLCRRASYPAHPEAATALADFTMLAGSKRGRATTA